jgi:hypothetical protein
MVFCGLFRASGDAGWQDLTLSETLFHYGSCVQLPFSMLIGMHESARISCSCWEGVWAAANDDQRILASISGRGA